MIEALIWCPDCGEDRFELHRVPTGQEGHFAHKLEPVGEQPVGDTDTCFDCGGNLTRRENG